VRNNGVGERGAPAEAIAQKKPVDPDKIFTRSGNDFGAPANKIDTHAGGNQKSLDHVDFKPGDSDKVPNGQYHPVETAGGSHRGGTDGAPSSAEVGPDAAAAAGGKPPQKPDSSYRVGPDRSLTLDEVGSEGRFAVGGKSQRNPNNSWDSDGFSTNRDDYDLFGVENRKDSSYLDHSSTHANGETRGADELVGAGVGRSEASVGAQGSYERAGAFGGSDPSRVSHGADGFGGTADFGANAGHAGHGAHGVSNSADVGGGVGDASRGTHAAGAPTGQGGGHVGADTGTHGGSSAPAQGPHRADPGMSTGDTHGVSRADSTPGHGDTPRAGHGADSTPDAPTTPKKDTPAGDSLGGDKQPHSGKHAADTPATHADEAADTSKAGHDSVEHADADPKAKDHSANGKADDDADSARHGDKTEADKPTSDKSHKEDDAAHHDGDEHPKDTDDKHTTKNDDADTKSTKDEADAHKSNKDSDAKSDKDGDGKTDKDDADTKSDKDDADGKSDKDGDAKTDKDDADTKSDKDDADDKSDDDNGGGESDNDTVSDKNAEESQEIKSEEGADEAKRNPHSGDPDHNWGTYVDENGVPHIDPSDPRPYLNPKNRPSFREETILKVWEKEVRPDGTVLDPAGRVIEWTPGTSRRGVWDMGHKPGQKYHDKWLEYINGDMTPAQFREWYNKPKHYRVEHPTTNRSHKFEDIET